MRKTGMIAAALLSAVVMTAPLASNANELFRTDSAEETLKDAERLAKETAERLMGTLRMLLEFVPQYEMPEVLENGDIIIRRKNPKKDKDDESEDDALKT